MRTIVTTSSALVLAACATQMSLTRVDYTFADNPQNRSIDLTYHNSTSHTMCLLPEHWPNQSGKINQGSDRMAIVVDDVRFPVEDFNTGYCPDGCVVRVAPGAEKSASVSYADFALPERLWSTPKNLEFSLLAYVCSAQ